MSEISIHPKIVNKEAPIGVKVISLMFYVFALGSLFLGLLLIFLGKSLVFLLDRFAGDLSGALNVSGTLIIIIGITLICFSLFQFFVGKGLRKGDKWARKTTIGLMIIVVVSAIVSISLFWVLIGGFILWYLGYTKEAKEYFS